MKWLAVQANQAEPGTASQHCSIADRHEQFWQNAMIGQVAAYEPKDLTFAVCLLVRIIFPNVTNNRLAYLI